MKRFVTAAACVALWLVAFGHTPASAQDWKPIDPAQLAMKTATVDPSADAEAIFWDRDTIDTFRNRDAETSSRNYMRIKIFNDRGKRFGKVQIIHENNVRVGDISARTIKPDGSIVELRKEEIFERELFRRGRRRVFATTFVMPAVEAGCLIEYRWSEYHRTFQYDRLNLQEAMPIEHLTVRFKPLPSGFYFNEALRLKMLNGKLPPSKEETPGTFVIRFENLPAFQTEPYIPPADNLRQWLLFYYAEDANPNPEKYWRNRGRKLFDEYRPHLRIDDDVKAAATRAVGDAANADQHLERLFAFCRTQIRNLADDATTVTGEERAANKTDQTPAETLKRGVGSPEQITRLFVALAGSLGFDAHVAQVSDRSDFVFDPTTIPDDSLLTEEIAAVRVGPDWKFFDPGEKLTTASLMPWWKQGIPALILDPKDPTFVVTPISKPEQSRTRRIGTFTLAEDGTLEGEARFEFSGHPAREWRERLDDASPARREEVIREFIQSRIAAEISDLRIDNLDNPAKLVVITCRVRATGYASRTGKRLVLPVSVFERNRPARFPDEKRVHPIAFEYPWLDEDLISFLVPPGYELENAEAPPTFTVPGNYGQYATKVAFSAPDRKLSYRRAFSFGRNDALMEFEPKLYPTIKTIFDEVRKADEHVIVLKTP